MALYKARSVFFRGDVRLGRSQNSRRSSLILDAADGFGGDGVQGKRFDVEVDLGLEVLIHDKREKTTMRVPWHMVADWDEMPKAAEPKGGGGK